MLKQIRNSRYRDFFIILPLIVVFFSLLCLSTSNMLSGDPEEFVLAGAMVAPFVILALLAYTGEQNRFARSIAVLWLLGLLLCIAAVSFALSLDPVAAFSQDPDDFDRYLESLPVATVGNLLLLSFGSGLISLIGFSRTFRRLLAKVLPFDPDSFIHTIGLVCVLALILMPLVPLIFTGNAPFLNADLQVMLGIGSEELGSTVKLDAFTLIWTVIGSFFLVGLWLRRDLPSTFERLGLVRPDTRQVILGVATGIILVGVFWLFDDAVSALFLAYGIPTTDDTLVNNLFMVSFTPLAAVMASVSAGLGEELSVRGVIQPRFGIILSALVFASLHAYQYAWDGLLGVFLVGICFGVLRKYTNTSTSAISHGVYDLTLFVLIMAGITTL